MASHNYTEDNIRSLEWKEHIRLRPGMYIGKLGDGSSFDDGIYVLVKEIIDNSIDEYVMGYGKTVEIEITNKQVSIRDYGRGIPLGKVVDCVAKMNTGGKYDSKAFQKAVGLNGVGTKAVNALSSYFRVQSIREGKTKVVEFSAGEITDNKNLAKTKEENGTIIIFQPDDSIFKNYRYIPEYLENLIWNYVYLNAGLTIMMNGKRYYSKRGLYDLVTERGKGDEFRYPIIHLKDDDIEIAMTHNNQYGEQYYSFVNGQYTTQGGTHQAAFREAVVKCCREHFKKNYDTTDIRASILASISIRIQEPVFESQTKTKLGSINMGPDLPTVKSFVSDFVMKKLDNFLHQNPETADLMHKRIMQSERERKEIAGVKKLARDRAKKANLHNKKLRDCRLHLNDKKGKDREETMIFITEGDSASGSLTKARNVQTQAVFSLRGKPLNCFNKSKKIVYENEEFNLLQHALNIEDGIDQLRYNKIIVATDADVDGMHIRLLLMTFFLQFFPDLVRGGHVFILETPLFRVRNKKETIYCYSEREKRTAVKKLGKNPEITRFKGLGEISPHEFEDFIGKDIRLSPVLLRSDSIKELLTYYMGKNTEERQHFIIDNLRFETDIIEEDETIEEAMVGD